MPGTGWIDEMVAAWNSFDGEKAAAFFAPDGLWEDLAVGFRHQGREKVAETWSVRTPAFSSDSRFDVESAIGDEERFAFQWRWSGTHNESGRRYDIRGASIGRLREALIVEQSDYWNPALFAEQLGGSA
jgi:uncharacterized protein (TIGR02246 family)